MFLNPKKVIAQLNLSHSAHVADMGAGNGDFSFACSALLHNGNVYSIEIQKNLADSLRHQIKSKKIKNIEVLYGNIEHYGGTSLKDKSIDLVILANTFFQVLDKDSCIKEVTRILKDNGKLLFIDWTSSMNHMGPHPKNIFTKENALEFFKRKNFKFVENVDAGDYHYGIIFSYER